VHLLAWLLLALAVSLHVATILRRGGLPLASSMASLQLRAGDLPGNWPGQLLKAFQARR
jgi:hypothetical protein